MCWCYMSQYLYSSIKIEPIFNSESYWILYKGIPLFFGKSIDVKCLKGLETFEIPTPEGLKEVCYAAKISTKSVFLPWKVYVDDYVFAVKEPVSGYYKQDSSILNRLQTSEKLPTPLPEYQLQGFELIWGNALWISIGLCVIAFSAEIINKKTKKI